MVPAWDRLQGLENGQWNGDAQAIRNAVNALSPDQRQTVRDDRPKMRFIMQRCGDVNDKFRVITISMHRSSGLCTGSTRTALWQR